MNYEAISVWSQIISSALFFVVLVWMFNKYLIPLVMTAQKNKHEEIARNEQRRDQAKATLETMRMQMGSAQQDAAGIRERTGEQAQRERDAALSQSRAAGERALRNAEGELDRSRAAARENLRNELAAKALALARAEAIARVTPEVNERLVDRFIGSIEGSGLN
ncbi:MAG: hypothetical protein NVS9B12_09770 [Vulcanimicrobiaceae bacterium]